MLSVSFFPMLLYAVPGSSTARVESMTFAAFPVFPLGFGQPAATGARRCAQQ
jgi:hypothetical protein